MNLIVKIFVGLFELTALVTRLSIVLERVEERSCFRRRTSAIDAIVVDVTRIMSTWCSTRYNGVTIAERVVCLVVIASCRGRRQHAHPLLLKGVLMLCFDRIIYNRLEHLDDEE